LSNPIGIAVNRSATNGSIYVTQAGGFFQQISTSSESGSFSSCSVFNFLSTKNTVVLNTSDYLISGKIQPCVDARNGKYPYRNGSSANGVATGVALGQPFGITSGLKGNLYFAEIGNHLIRVLNTSSNLLERLCGRQNGTSGNFDGICSSNAAFKSPINLDISLKKNILYITDFNSIRVIPLNIYPLSLYSPYASCLLSSVFAEYGRTGTSLSKFELSIAVDPITDLVYLGINRKIYQFSSFEISGSTSPVFNHISGSLSGTNSGFVTSLAFDALGKLFVLDGSGNIMMLARVCPLGFYQCYLGLQKVCPTGSYCPLDSIMFTPCPEGTYNPYEQQSSIQSCLPCSSLPSCPSGSSSYA